LKNLARLRLYQNHLNGEINFQLESLPSLQQLFLQQNYFHGHLQQLFSFNSTNSTNSLLSAAVSNHPFLNLDVSDNLFSGSVPSQLFLLPHLQSISLSLNCFEHELPMSMCEAVGVGVMSMSGLGSSHSCKNLVTVPFTSVSLVQTMDGSIPDCVWLLSNLRILNLAGNGLSGTIGDVSLMSSLLSLTLSHNYLRGVIPLWLQEKNMSQLDLSHNKLTGTVDGFKNQNKEELNSELINLFLGSDPATRELKLSVNRLSGDLSHSFFKRYTNLDILSGNLFGCNHIPSNDENSEWAICGSEEFDQSLFVMGGVCGLIVLCLVLSLLRSPHSNSVTEPTTDHSKPLESLVLSTWFDRRLLEYHKMTHDIRFYSGDPLTSCHSFPAIRSFGYFLSNLNRAMCLLTCVLVIISLPIYILKVLDVESPNGSEQYVTHSHMYRWLWTVVFVTGTVPCLLFLLVTFLCLLCFSLILNMIGTETRSLGCERVRELENQSASDRGFNRKVVSLSLSLQTHENENENEMIRKKEVESLFSVAVWLVLMTNIAMVGTVNGLYLWSTLLNLSNDVRFLIQILFGLFIFTWRVVILPSGLPLRLKESRYGLWLFSWINVVNTVVIPCVVTALSDPSCYQVSYNRYFLNAFLMVTFVLEIIDPTR
jgi:hypothetical protein